MMVSVDCILEVNLGVILVLVEIVCLRMFEGSVIVFFVLVVVYFLGDVLDV